MINKSGRRKFPFALGLSNPKRLTSTINRTNWAKRLNKLSARESREEATIVIRSSQNGSVQIAPDRILAQSDTCVIDAKRAFTGQPSYRVIMACTCLDWCAPGDTTRSLVIPPCGALWLRGSHLACVNYSNTRRYLVIYLPYDARGSDRPVSGPALDWCLHAITDLRRLSWIYGTGQMCNLLLCPPVLIIRSMVYAGYFIFIGPYYIGSLVISLQIWRLVILLIVYSLRYIITVAITTEAVSKDTNRAYNKTPISTKWVNRAAEMSGCPPASFASRNGIN